VRLSERSPTRAPEPGSRRDLRYFEIGKLCSSPSRRPRLTALRARLRLKRAGERLELDRGAERLGRA